jgi:hypothetical protein
VILLRGTVENGALPLCGARLDVELEALPFKGVLERVLVRRHRG